MGNEDQADYKKLMNSLKIGLRESISGLDIQLKGFKVIFEFFKSESEFWNKSPNKEGVLGHYVSHFNAAVQRLTTFQNNITTGGDEASYRHCRHACSASFRSGRL